MTAVTISPFQAGPGATGANNRWSMIADPDPFYRRLRLCTFRHTTPVWWAELYELARDGLLGRRRRGAKGGSQR